MDENYLDQLLKEVEETTNSNKESDDIDISKEVADSEDTTIEERLDEDASSIRGVAWSDAEIPVDEISELDELDKLADLDMDSLDFEDIDFDDIDVTKMNVNPVQLEKELEDFEHLDIDESYFDDSEDLAFEEEFKKLKHAEGSEPYFEDQDYVDTFEEQEASLESDTDNLNDTDSIETKSYDANETMDSKDSSDSIDSFMDEILGASSDGFESSDASFDDAFNKSFEDSFNKAFDDSADSEADESSDESSTQNDDMDDLFAMLGIEEDPSKMAASAAPDPANEIPDFEIPPELADVQDINDVKKNNKKSFMDILFGEDDEEEVLTPEQEEELTREKEAKKEAKLAKKEADKAEKAEKKKLKKENKTAQINAKKAARKAEDERILAEDGPEKKLNKPLVVIIMIFFLAIGGAVIVGTNVFDYTLVITKAKNYFERQKYGLAYREIVGVEVKEKDEELESRIYTVMFVERQYEAYQNYVKMNRPDQALNALLIGLDKYDEYYEEAVELDIVSDIDYAKGEILTALQEVFGMSESDAKELIALDNAEYTEAIKRITDNTTFQVE